MAETNEVRNPYQYFPDPTQGRPVFNGSIYIGNPDSDPQIAANQKQLTAYTEEGGTVAVSQPIKTGAGGVPLINNSPVQLVVEGEYSIKVLNSKGAQVYYAPSLVDGVRPSFVVRTQITGFEAVLPERIVNGTLYATNTSFQQYYDAEAPTMDLGDLNQDPFTLENIPAQRFDLSQGNSTIDLGVL